MMTCLSCFFTPIFWGAIFAGFIYLLRQYMQGGKYTKYTTAIGKVVIVTGANTGIGKETVLELAKRGATVYMACRDMTRCEAARKQIIEETGNKRIYARELDLASLDSVRKFAENFKKDEQKLDILINNAGVMLCPLLRTKEGFELQIGTNHMGHFLLTNLLLDLLKSSAPSRIVVLSSRAHIRGTINKSDLNSERDYNSMQAYSQSKLANVLFTRELAKRLQDTAVTINALHPGVVETELGRHLWIFKNPIARVILQILVRPFIKTAKNGAQTTIYAALDPDLDNVSGKYFSDCALKDVAPAALDEVTAQWLWKESEKWTKLNE